MSRTNYYSSKTANSRDVIRAGFAKLAQEAARLKSTEAWLVLNGKSNLNGWILEFIGDGAAKQLSNGNRVRLTDSCSLLLYTDRTVPFGGNGPPVLCAFPTTALLTKLDGMHNVPSLIVLPWVMEEITGWLTAHGPIDILGLTAVAKSQVANPVVERALETLYAVINVSTGIAHPSDKATAIQVFTILRSGRESYTATEVRSWLVQRGMAPRQADQIAEIAENPSRYRASSSGPLRADILQTWRSDSAQIGLSQARRAANSR